MNKREGPTLRELREQNKKTLSEIAEALNVSVRAVSRYEQGTRRISLEQVLILANLYDSIAEDIIWAQINSCR